MIDEKLVQLYEKRIDNCVVAAKQCKDGSWARDFWDRTEKTLLRNLNYIISNDGKCNEIYSYNRSIS